MPVLRRRLHDARLRRAAGGSGREAAGEAPTWGGAPLQPGSGAGCWQLLHLGLQCLELAGMVLMAVLWLLTLGSH